MPTVSIEKMYMDETNSDLVVIGDGEVYFYNCVLPSEAAKKPGPEEPSYPSDVVHLVTKNKSSILVAKRNGFPTLLAQLRQQQKAFICAVMHTDRAVHFYLPPVGSRSDACEPFLVFRCSPKTLRFRNDDYPIRTVYWQRLPSAASPADTNNNFDTQSVVSASNGGAAPRPVLILVLSEICIDLVRLSGPNLNDDPGHPRESVATVVKRVTTQIHYYSFDPVSRVAFLLNMHKPSVGKPFRVERSSVLSTMPQIKLDAQTELACNPCASAMMDAPRIQYQIAPIEIYGQLYVYQVTPRGQIVLHAYVKQRPGSQVEAYFERRLVLDLEGLGDSPEPSPLRFAHSASFANSRGSPSPSQAASFSSACGSAGTPLVKIQIVDNLIVAHYVHIRRTGVFDVNLAASNTSAVVTPSGDTFATSTSPLGNSEPTNSLLSSGNAPLQASAAGSANLRQSYRDPVKQASPTESDSSRGGGGGSFASWRGSLQPSAGSTGAANTAIPPPGAAKYLRVAMLAQLQILPSSSTTSSHTIRPHMFYDHEVYSAGPNYLPIFLDRESMQVMLLNVDATSIADGIRDIPMRVQFLLNRFACGGDAVPDLLVRLLREHEQATTMAQVFDLVSAHNFASRTAARLNKRLRVHSTGTAAARDRPPILVGSPMVIARMFLPHATTLLSQEIVSRFGCGRLFSSDPPDDRMTLDQATIYRKVFAPLSEECTSQLPALMGDAGAASSSCSRDRESGMEGGGASPPIQHAAPSPTTSVEIASHYSASYLLYALLEFARSLIQHGDSLSDAIQRCIVNMFLQTPPNYFRLHQLLMYRAVDDHIPTALQLITLESQYPPAFQMGLDMLSRLGAQNEIVQVLVAKRLPLAAAKYVFTTGMRDAPVLDILYCSSLLHDEEIARRQQQQVDVTRGGTKKYDATSSPPSSPRTQVAKIKLAKKNRKERQELSAQGAEFHTIFTLMLNHLLSLGDETVMMQPSFEAFKSRYNKISAGQLF